MAPKKKGEKMQLGDFLADQSLGSWADEMETQPMPSAPTPYRSARGGDSGDGGRDFASGPAWGSTRQSSGMGMGDGGAGYDRPRFGDREQLPLPSKPPYTAHLGNLAFDITQSDLESFLGDCAVTSVRIVEDKLDRKPKGFGYVEFGTLDGLKKALTLSESEFMGRRIRISVAEPPKERAEGAPREITDWTRRGPLPDLPQQGRQMSRGYSRGGANFDSASDAGSERGGGDRRRPGFFEGDGKVRDFSNWERKGPLSPAPSSSGPPVRDGGRLRESGGGPAERRNSPSWGEGRSEAGSRPPRREFSERPAPVDRAPTAAEQDNQWRARMKADPSPAPTPDVSTPSSPAAAQAPKERPRLNLTKRTVSTAEGGADSGNTSASENNSKASPFGAARPIDTATREKEIDEKRQLATKQKKEAEEKAAEEKKEKEAAARQARADRADRGQSKQDDSEKPPAQSSSSGDARQSSNRRPSQRQQNGATKTAGPNENGDAPAKEKPSFSILQRETEGEDAEGPAEADEADEVVAGDVPDAPANGNILSDVDRDTKPQEVVREVPSSGEATQGDEAGGTTAEGMEEAGWSTVAGKAKGGKRGGARAIAS